MLSFFLVAIAPVFVSVVLCQNSNEYWSNPPPAGSAGDYSNNQVWQVGSTQTLKWYDDYLPVVSLVLWQDYNQGGGEASYDLLINQSVTDPGLNFQWTVDISQFPDANLGTAYYFRLYNGSSSSSQYIESHYVNILPSSSSSTTPTPTPTTSLSPVISPSTIIAVSTIGGTTVIISPSISIVTVTPSSSTSSPGGSTTSTTSPTSTISTTPKPTTTPSSDLASSTFAGSPTTSENLVASKILGSGTGSSGMVFTTSTSVATASVRAPSTTASPTPHSGLTSSAKVGLGVGLGVGIPLIIAAGFLTAFLLRRQRNGPPPYPETSEYGISKN